MCIRDSSHADTVQIDTHTKTIIGVTETKEFEKSEDSPDVDPVSYTHLFEHWLVHLWTWVSLI